MSRQIVPLANLQRRLPEAGRIRTGVQVAGTSSSGKSYTRPKAIETFRFTSQDEDAIRQIAEAYGGAVEPWSAPSGAQWQVITEANEIRIVLPPDPLGGSPIYELWGKGGCDRRCDGVTCQTVARGPDGPEYTDVPCICEREEGRMSCDPHTRLSVILPEVRFAGVWRYESAKSWTVAQELPGMIDLVASLQTRGLTHALLAIEHRKTTTAGETKRFTIPVIRVPHSFTALEAGAASVGSLGSGPAPAPQIAAGETSSPPEADDVGTPPLSSVSPAVPVIRDPEGDASGAAHPSDDDIVDAELVDDEALDIEGIYAAASMTPTRALKHARRVAERKGLPLPLSVDEITGDLARYVAHDLATSS